MQRRWNWVCKVNVFSIEKPLYYRHMPLGIGVFSLNLMYKNTVCLFITKLPVLFLFISWRENWEFDQSSNCPYFLVLLFLLSPLVWLLISNGPSSFDAIIPTAWKILLMVLRKRSFRKRKPLFLIFTCSCDLVPSFLKILPCVQIIWR